jgi:hypothetical protein
MLGCCCCASILSEADSIALVNLLPSGSQIVLTAIIFIGKKRFSINLLSVACASTNQTLLWNSSSNFFDKVEFDRIVLMFDPDNAIMKSSSTLDEDYIYQAIKL